MKITEMINEIKDRKFYSENLKGFVIIKDEVLHVNDITIDLNKVSSLEQAEELMKTVEDLVYEAKTKHRMEKETSHAFGKDVFLLGKDEEGKTVWLEEPKWDCGWYWGFGYVETYTGNHPSHSRDIQSHTHFSSLVGAQEYYDTEKGCFRKGEYIHNVYDSPRLVETAFSYNEGWKLSELFRQFYLLQKMAEFAGREKPNCHVTSDSGVDHGDMKEWSEHINKVMIPKITAKIMEILSPEVQDETV
jgi:hypothetical protein